MRTSGEWQEDAVSDLLDARDRCVYRSRCWRMCDNAVLHLFNMWLSELWGRSVEILEIRGDLVKVRT